MGVQCDYCGQPAQLVGGDAIYPHRPDLFRKKFWSCARCDAYVGCHPKAGKNGRGGLGDGTVPLGRLADRQLRRAKSSAHTLFDPIWKSGQMPRKKAYAWLAEKMGIATTDCHIGMFNVDQCNEVVRHCRQYSNPTGD